MSATATPARPADLNRWTSPATARQALESSWSCPSDAADAEALAARMFELQVGVWHAAHTLMLERLELPTCTHCEGPAPAGLTAHSLCAVRAERGLPTPRLDATPACPCHPCAVERGEKQPRRR